MTRDRPWDGGEALRGQEEGDKQVNRVREESRWQKLHRHSEEMQRKYRDGKRRRKKAKMNRAEIKR